MADHYGFMTSDTSASIHSVSVQLFDGFADEAYRHAYIDEHVNTFVPLQIRTIREQRGWTQAELGQRCGGKAQAWISQLEDLNYGRFSLATLRAVARAFDCILEVRFKSFKDYSDEQDRRRPGDTRVNTYTEDAAASVQANAERLTRSTSEGLSLSIFPRPQQIKMTIQRSSHINSAYVPGYWSNRG